MRLQCIGYSLVLGIFFITLALGAPGQPPKPNSDKSSPAFTKTDFAVFDSTLAAIARKYAWSEFQHVYLQDQTGIKQMGPLADLDESVPDVIGRTHPVAHYMVLEAMSRAEKAVSLAEYKPQKPFGRISFPMAEKYRARQLEIFADEMRNPPIDPGITPYDDAPLVITLSLPTYSRNHQEVLMLAIIDVGLGKVETAYVYLKYKQKAWGTAWIDIIQFIF